MTDKKIKIEFAPGAFDDFEGTQEELDAMQAEIIEMFANLTPEELEARSRPVDDKTLAELLEHDPEVVEKLLNPHNRPLH